MRALIIAGPRNGEWVDLADGSAMWVDLLTAETYRVRKITYVMSGPDGTATDMWKLPILVHPQLIGHPQEAQIVQGVLNQMIAEKFMPDYMREFGERQELGDDAAMLVPDSPAELFRPDGGAKP